MNKYRGTAYTVFQLLLFAVSSPIEELVFIVSLLHCHLLMMYMYLVPCPGLSLEAQLLVQSVIKVWKPLNSWLSIILFTSCIFCQLNTVWRRKQCSLKLPILRHLMMLGQDKMRQRERDMGLVV